DGAAGGDRRHRRHPRVRRCRLRRRSAGHGPHPPRPCVGRRHPDRRRRPRPSCSATHPRRMTVDLGDALKWLDSHQNLERMLAAELSAVADLEPLTGEHLSWFDILTGVGYRWFADLPVHAAVVEVGLGGLWDSTNIADGQVAVVTNVGMDHIEFLGPTQEDVA